jgi:hypothetical protein
MHYLPMEDSVGRLALVVGPCPECGEGTLQPVFDTELTNFLCRDCGACWHPELAWVHRVNPATCPGCSERGVCLTPKRRFGDPPGE